MDQSIFYGKKKAARNEKKATWVFIFKKMANFEVFLSLFHQG